MGGKTRTLVYKSRKFFAVFLMVVITFVNLSEGLKWTHVTQVEAAQVSIDPEAGATSTLHIQSGSQTVFIDDQIGYKFFVDHPGYCVYRKTTDGGASWSGTTTVDAQTDCVQITVWYDEWTPGSASSSIHIATLDTSADDIFYNRLDPGSDSLLLGTSPVSMVSSSGQGGTITTGANQISITRGTDGTIYASSIDASDSYVVECTINCNLATSWTETGSNPFGLTNNYAILAPLPGGDILAIHRDTLASFEDIGSKVWHNGALNWDAATTTFDSNAPDNATYDVGMSVTVSPTTGDIYLAYIARNATPGADDQIRTARYSSGSWTLTKEVVRYSEFGITNLAIALDSGNDDIYVTYSARTTPTSITTANIYWRKSTDTMESWSYQYGPLNSSADDFYGVDLNKISDERIYATWFDDTDNDIFGETVEDIFPGIHVVTSAFDEINSNDAYTQVTIDSTAHANGTANLMAGSQVVFTDDQTGYKFFRDAPGYCVYSKTTNGGTSWSATTSVDAQTDCIMITVWYDKWTPGSASSSIHIATLDTGNDDVWYNRLNTSDDTLLLASTSVVSMLTGSGQGGTTITDGENFISITRGTDGTIYAVSNDGTGANDSFIVECTVSCQTAGNWTETIANPLDVASDQNILAPLSGGDIMLINRDISADLIRYKIWNNTIWSAGWTNIDAAAAENATYDIGMSVAVSTSTNDLYFAYIADNFAFGTNDQVRTAQYTGGGWTAKTNVSASTVLGLTNVSIALDSSNHDVYVAYSAQATATTTTTANLLWKKSTDAMTSWGYEQGPINTSPDDLYGVNLNVISSERLYVTWYDNTDDDIYGATLINLPSTALATTGSQISSVYASTSDVYIGGIFALYNTDDSESFDITGITITENGTIDGSTNIANVKLLYEMDNTSPHDCASVSYGGSETQFGSTDTNGFSGADGVSSFTGSTVTVSTTSTMCAYVVLDIFDSTQSSSTIEISIADPTSDVTVTGSTAGPATDASVPGTTIVYNDTPTLVHFHWRNDDNIESTATSKTGGIEDTTLGALRQGSTTRLRVEVWNPGSSSTPAIQYRLEFAQLITTCSDVSSWTDVGATADVFDMYDSTFLTEGDNTTDIVLGIGGVTNATTTFLTPNAGVKDTSSQTGALTLTSTEFVELEYSIVATTTAPQGDSYCFRLTDQGAPLFAYTVYPTLSINADVSVNIATSSQKASTTLPVSNYYIGSAFVIAENSSSRTVDSITITENGTVDAQNGLDNIKLQYDLDSTTPYNCAGESYGGGELQYGSTDTDGFSSANGSSTFTGSVTISTTSAMCLYTVLDVASSTQNGETIDIVIENPSTYVLVSGGGSVSPSITRDMNGSTTLVGPILTLTHYHWRNDNGGEATSTSATNGSEDTSVSNLSQSTPIRLRVQISNEGTATSTQYPLRLEYATKITTCSAVSSWTDVGDTGDAWDMFDSTYLQDASNTTNIAPALGGVTNENIEFVSPNFAVKDASSSVASTSLSGNQYIEAEYSIRQTTDAGFDTPYCFRVSANGASLNAYSVYPELRTSPERDFEIQRDTETFLASTTTFTITAGIDYVAPSASTSAFIRITNIGMTGAGHNTGATAAQNATNTTVYIQNPSNIMNSITFVRTGISSTTRVSWEIVEFIGEPGSDNEMIVRSQTNVQYVAASTSATGTVVSGIVDDNDVVVFITGQQNPDTGSTNYNTGLSTSEWVSADDTPVFRRGEAAGDAGRVSYAVVEFTGQNWAIQRAQHTYTSAGSTETEDITAVGSLTRTFLHTQKRSGTGLNGTDEFGHEVWFSGIGVVSFFLETGATTPSGQISVAWIIENTQTTAGEMNVTHVPGSTNSGTGPFTLNVDMGITLDDITNTSILGNARSSLTTTVFPRPIAGLTIASTTHFEIWRSNTGSTLTFRVEIVEWPTAGLAIRQNYYRFYVDNNALDPTDPWPTGGVDLGENTVLTGSDEPLGEDERVRIRMSLQAINATFPADTRAFRLQYGVLVSTCSAISEGGWTTLGNSASSTVWRGYNATGTTDGTQLSGDPPTVGDLNLSLSDVAGTLEEQNDTGLNAYTVLAGEDIEYDWIIEQNGANGETYYCFRMVESDGTPLDGYQQYPQLRTASFTPRSQNWRWYNDEQNETPTTTLAAENVAPVNITNGQALTLRVTVKEIKNIPRDDVRFKLQYSEYADFTVADDVVATSTCTATSTWCYANGGGVDNAKISTTTLTDADSCFASVGDGCGTHNESPDALTGFRHQNNASAEYSYTIQSAGPRVNRVYYFRLYDLVQDLAVPTNTDESYPSIVTEGSTLTFTMSGIASSTILEGVTTNINTTDVSVPFGTLVPEVIMTGAHRLNVDTDGTQGHQILMMLTGDLMTSSGAYVRYVTGTNASPIAWNTGCDVGAVSCFGYHTGDDTLQGGSTRFSAVDTYAGFSTTTLEEVAYTSQPVQGDTTDIVFRLMIRNLQDAGQYETNIRYVSVPMF